MVARLYSLLQCLAESHLFELDAVFLELLGVYPETLDPAIDINGVNKVGALNAHDANTVDKGSFSHYNPSVSVIAACPASWADGGIESWFMAVRTNRRVTGFATLERNTPSAFNFLKVGAIHCTYQSVWNELC